MNTDQLARATFVIDRSTHEQLGVISRRMKQSRSEVVREILVEPIALMAKWVESLPEQPTEGDRDSAIAGMQQDLVDYINRHSEELGAIAGAKP